ncbi:MAG: type 1 glutamine amidotransferase [Chloroflexota bacterium]
MKLGILDAVPAKYYTDDDVVTDPERFIALLRSVNFTGEIVSFHVAEQEFPPSVDTCDAYLITGSPATAFESRLWIDDLKQFIRDVYAARVPLVGICFGHQVIAMALGGTVETAESGWMVGLYSFDVIETPPWIGPDDLRQKNIYHFNRDQVINLPTDAVHLGASETCPNSMYAIGDTVFAIQGHPEMPLSAMKQYLVELKDTLPADVVEYAHQSTAANQPDVLILGTWLKAFIERDF